MWVRWGVGAEVVGIGVVVEVGRCCSGEVLKFVGVVVGVEEPGTPSSGLGSTTDVLRRTEKLSRASKGLSSIRDVPAALKLSSNNGGGNGKSGMVAEVINESTSSADGP